MYVPKVGWIEPAHTVTDAEESQVLPPALSVAEDSLGALILLLLPSAGITGTYGHTQLQPFNVFGHFHNNKCREVMKDSVDPWHSE